MLTFTPAHIELLAYFAISAFFLCFAWGLNRVFPFYQQLTSIHSTSRYPALDGLRGFLALGVFFHHSVIVYYQQVTGRWETPPSEFYALLGHVGFALFFMLTGFLFWQKALQGEPFKALRFYKTRFQRLAPAYFFSMGLICLAAALPFGEESLTHFVWKDLINILQFKGPNSTKHFSVYWTLVWEWKYYLLLPLMALLAGRWWAWLLVVLLVAHIEHKPSHIFLFNFVVGGLVAGAATRYSSMLARLKPFADVTACGVLVYLFSQYSEGHGYAQSMILGVFFLCIVAGGRLFGLLTSRPALLLGTVSYSIYLQHCIVIYVLVRALNLYVATGSLTLQRYFLLIPFEGTCIILLALLSYRYIEHPFMAVRTKLRA